MFAVVIYRRILWMKKSIKTSPPTVLLIELKFMELFKMSNEFVYKSSFQMSPPKPLESIYFANIFSFQVSSVLHCISEPEVFNTFHIQHFCVYSYTRALRCLWQRFSIGILPSLAQKTGVAYILHFPKYICHFVLEHIAIFLLYFSIHCISKIPSTSKTWVRSDRFSE